MGRGFPDRLRDALGEQKRRGRQPSSIRSLSAALEERGVRGATRSMLHRYLKPGGPEPPRELVQVAAELLGVREAWLLFGERPAAPPITSKGRRTAGTVSSDERYVRGLEEEDTSGQRSGRTAAVRRFSQRLDDASAIGARVPWAGREDRHYLLAAAYAFLAGVEDAFGKAGRQRPDAPADSGAGRMFHDHLLLRDSPSAGEYVVWSDAVLSLFASRVYGLGARVGDLHDPHVPPHQREEE